MRRILIIDDEQCIFETISEFSKELGYDPIHIEDPSFCSLPCHEQKSCPKVSPCVDLLLVDQYLPSTFGLKFVKELNQRGCKIPIGSKAVMSAVLSSDEKAQAKELGYDVLIKPVSFDVLKDWLLSCRSNVA